MQNTKSALSYRDAGVDKDEGIRAVEKMKHSAGATHGPEVLGGLGAFAGLYSLEGLKEYRNPVLVSGTDGVGTKLRLALDARRYHVIGRDCYAMAANDILCHGARPLFFLDYIACGRLSAEVAAAVVEGITAACLEDGCALIGGETAEMPGFYPPGDYDVAGFIVGIAEKDKLIGGPDSSVAPGDIVIGLTSDGAHSNGFSLIRTLFPGSVEHPEEFLTPTRIYGPVVRRLLPAPGTPSHSPPGTPPGIKAMAHITGGGIPENLPRAFAGRALDAVIRTDTWEEPDIFARIRRAAAGRVSEDEMRGTFNLGIGFTLIVSPEDAEDVLSRLRESGEDARRIGELREGSGKVCFV